MNYVKRLLGFIFVFLSLANYSFAETVRYVLSAQENIRRLEESGNPILQLVASLPKGTVIEVDVDDVKKQKEAVRKNAPGSNFDYIMPGGGKQKSKNGWTRGVKVISVPDAYKDKVSPELINKSNLFFSINSLETLTVREGSNSSGREIRRTTSSIPGLAPTPPPPTKSQQPKGQEVARSGQQTPQPAKPQTAPQPTSPSKPPTPPPSKAPASASPEDAVSALDQAGRIVKKLNRPYNTAECGVVRTSGEFGHRHGFSQNGVSIPSGHHNGVDIVMRHGAPIRSAASGRVTAILPTSATYGFGNVVEVEHGEYINGVWHGMGLKTRYAHLSGFAPGLKVGNKVSSGELVAMAGTTGRSTGTHLHFEVYEQNARGGWGLVNPRKYVSF